MFSNSHLEQEIGTAGRVWMMVVALAIAVGMNVPLSGPRAPQSNHPQEAQQVVGTPKAPSPVLVSAR